MTRTTRSILVRYGLAVLSVALALALCRLLDPILHVHLHYLWMILALLFTGYYGGARPCSFAFVLSLLGLIYYFLPPRHSFVVEDPLDQIGLLLYILVGSAVILFSSATMRSAKRLAESATQLTKEMPAKLAMIEKQLIQHVEENQKTLRLMSVPCRVANILAKASHLREITKPILRTICESLDWQVGLFWTVDRQAQVLRCVEFWHSPGIEGSPFEQYCRQNTFVLGVGLAGRVWATRQLVCIPDMSLESHLPRSLPAAQSGLRGAVAFPVEDGLEFLGVMEFFSHAAAQPDDCVVQMMATLSGQIGQFIERRAAEKSLREQERERRVAYTIQQGLLPKRMPSSAGFQISGKSAPAQDVGGDCFDFIGLGGDGMAIVLADASGHGIGPALIVAETHAYLHALTTICSDVGQILTLTNQRLAGENLDDRFVTLFLGRLDPSGKSLVYSSAGHCPGYLLDADGKIKMVLASLGLPLGIDANKAYPTSLPIPLQSDDLLLLYSDGVIDARAPSGEPFGVDRMLDVVRLRLRDPLENILDALFCEISDYSPDCRTQDDRTAVLLRVEPSLCVL
jgi:serine phosphatase RsbU (regulator of sigma subunit)